MHYFCRQNLFETLGMIEIVGHTAETGEHNWIAGVPWTRPLRPQTLELNPESGTNFPAFFDSTVPVMSESLIAAFVSAGVDNFDQYPVVLRRADTGEEFTGYAAVNFRGAVDAVDLENSEFTKDETFGDVEFTGAIEIDCAKTRGLLAFRLTEGPGFLVVAESVAMKLQKISFPALLLQPTKDYEGV